jgi:hypothetical protein
MFIFMLMFMCCSFTCTAYVDVHVLVHVHVHVHAIPMPMPTSKLMPMPPLLMPMPMSCPCPVLYSVVPIFLPEFRVVFCLELRNSAKVKKILTKFRLPQNYKTHFRRHPTLNSRLKVPKREIFDFVFFASKEPIWSPET